MTAIQSVTSAASLATRNGLRSPARGQSQGPIPRRAAERTRLSPSGAEAPHRSLPYSGNQATLSARGMDSDVVPLPPPPVPKPSVVWSGPSGQGNGPVRSGAGGGGYKPVRSIFDDWDEQWLREHPDGRSSGTPLNKDTFRIPPEPDPARLDPRVFGTPQVSPKAGAFAGARAHVEANAGLGPLGGIRGTAGQPRDVVELGVRRVDRPVYRRWGPAVRITAVDGTYVSNTDTKVYGVTTPLAITPNAEPQTRIGATRTDPELLKMLNVDMTGSLMLGASSEGDIITAP